VRRSVEFDHEAAKLVGVVFVVLQVDALDVCEGVLDLVACLLIVDVVGHGAFVGRVEHNQIHRVLSNTGPLANGEGAAGKMMDHCVMLEGIAKQENR
jgi:hypothetical protein